MPDLFPVPGEPRDPREDLHDAIQRAVQALRPDAGGAVTRWAVIVELAQPNGEMSFNTITGNAAAVELQSWDANGFLVTALTRSLRRSLGIHGPPPPPF